MIKQPNSSFCFVCGLENHYGLKMNFYNSATGEVISEYRVGAEFQGYPGIVHGGIVASMLDEVTARALMPEGETRFMVTAKLTLRYRKPVPIEQPLKLVGRAEKDNGKVAKAVGFIYGPDGDLLAEAEAVLTNIPETPAPEEAVENFGWKVYPDEEDSP